MSSLLLGKDRVSEAEVMAVPAVPFTKTFHPVHHRDFIQSVREGVKAVGLEIVKSEFVLAAGGQKMFGVYDLSAGSSELCWSIGIRNSMNKSMSLGISAGTRVFVCENLCFSGDFLTLKRRTGVLDADMLAFLAYRAMRTMIPKLEAFQRWHQGLKNYLLPQSDMRILLVEIMEHSVIPVTKFNDFNGLYSKVYDDSLWGFHETVTDILRE
ncbi:MAG: hypothetical protein JZU65_05395, partial [Chlorobium sp.]|nr:hypothetical protein [Chlorobium sp.]